MDEGLRKNKPTGKEDVKRVWKYAQIWAKETFMQEKSRLSDWYLGIQVRSQVSLSGESSHAVLLPISKPESFLLFLTK